MVINLKIGSPSIKAPGLTHFPHRMGVVAMVAVTMTSAHDAASSTVEQAFAPISFANFCALANVLLHTLTLKEYKVNGNLKSLIQSWLYTERLQRTNFLPAKAYMAYFTWLC